MDNNSNIYMMLSKVAECAMNEAATAEHSAEGNPSTVLLDAIEDLYSVAALCQKVSEWITLQPDEIESVPEAIITLCVEVAAATRAEFAMGVQGSLVNSEGNKTWH